MANHAYDDLFEEVGKRRNVHPSLLKTAWHLESGGRTTAGKSLPNDPDSPDGPFQMRPSTARGLGVTDVKDFEKALDAAAMYLREGLDKTGTGEGALAYYHAGPDRRGWGPKTAAYVAKGQGLAPTMAVSPTKKDDDVLNQWLGAGGKTEAPAPSAEAKPAVAANDDDVLKRWLGPETKADAKPSVPPSVAPMSQPPAIIDQRQVGSLDAPVMPTRFQPRSRLGPRAVAPVDTTALDMIPSKETVRNALAPNPEAGQILPLAGDASQGTLRPAVPNMVLDFGRGIMDLLEGTRTGTVTPEATLALTMGLGGPGMSSVARGTGRAISGEAARLADTGVVSRNRLTAGNAEALNRIGDDLIYRIQNDVQGPARGQYLLNQITGAMERADAPINPIPSRQPVSAPPVPPPQLAIEGPAGPRSIGAAATPPQAAAMTDKEMRANRYEAEMSSVLEPQPRGEDRTIYVPGSVPTKAEYSGDPKISQQEKLLRERNPVPFDNQLTANNKARVKLYDDLAGSKPQIDMMEQAREAQAVKNLNAAFGNKKDVNATPVVQAIDDIFAAPRSGENEAVRTFLAPIRDQLFDAKGKLKADPERLYGIRENVAQKINKASKAADPRVANAERELIAVKDALDSVIEQGAPGYKKYLADYTEASKPINAMEMLLEFRPKLTSGKTDDIMFTRFDKFMKDLIGDRAEGGISPAKSLPDETVQKLVAIHRDMKRANNIDLGEAKGSPTNLRGAVAGALGMPAAHAAAGMLFGPVGNAALQFGSKIAEPIFGQMKMNKLTREYLGPPGQK